jgi:hypothetical protein
VGRTASVSLRVPKAREKGPRNTKRPAVADLSEA